MRSHNHRVGFLGAIIGLCLIAAACDAGPSSDPASPTPTGTVSPAGEASPGGEIDYVEVTAATCLNIRARPSLDAAVVGCAPNGTVLRRAGGPRDADGRRWLRVAGAWEGWAAAEFLRKTDKPPKD